MPRRCNPSVVEEILELPQLSSQNLSRTKCSESNPRKGPHCSNQVSDHGGRCCGHEGNSPPAASEMLPEGRRRSDRTLATMANMTTLERITLAKENAEPLLRPLHHTPLGPPIDAAAPHRSNTFKFNKMLAREIRCMDCRSHNAGVT